MLSWFQKKQRNRSIYAVREGSYKGNFFVFINKIDELCNFLILPDNDVVSVPTEEFEQGIEKKIVDYIEELPKNIHTLCCAQYNESKAKDNINRLKQSTASSSVDRGERKNER